MLTMKKWSSIMLPYEKHDANKDLVAATIELVLMKIGRLYYERVLYELYKEYRCFMPDCYEHPEYLQNVLMEIFGDCSKVIVESITKDLKNAVLNQDIEQFLQVMCK